MWPTESWLPARLRSRDHGVALLHVDGHWFFHQHVLASLQRGYGYFAVQTMRQADDDEVNPLVREQIFVRGVALAPMLRADAGEAFRVRIGDRSANA